MTGVTQVVEALKAKELQLLHELVPDTKAVFLLINPTNPNSLMLTDIVKTAAESLSIQITLGLAATAGEQRSRLVATRELED